jgi:hypothetical protein
MPDVGASGSDNFHCLLSGVGIKSYVSLIPQFLFFNPKQLLLQLIAGFLRIAIRRNPGLNC